MKDFTNCVLKIHFLVSVIYLNVDLYYFLVDAKQSYMNLANISILNFVAM